jgi:inner membrane transporter RhtA
VSARAVSARARLLAVPAPVFIVGSALSTQCAHALAVHAFRTVPVEGVVFARVAFAALALGLVVRLTPRRLTGHTARAWRWAVAFGLAVALMNSCFYLSLDRLSLGTAQACEFWGPIAVAVAGSRRRLDLVWAGLALVGVLLLAGDVQGGEAVGIVLALGAGGAWAAYIVIGRRVAHGWPGTTGLAIALTVAAVVLAPPGLAVASSQLAEPRALALCLGVGVLASALPYGLEQVALRRVPARTFGVLLALNPVAAATVGAVLLHQGLARSEAIAIVLVTVAAAGAMRGLTGHPES